MATDDIFNQVAQDLETAGLTPSLAADILERHCFAVDSGRRLHVYEHGHYVPRGEALVKSEVKRLLNERQLSSKWTSNRANEVLEYITVDAPELWEQPPLDTINVANGLLKLDPETWEFIEKIDHTSNHLSPIQIPVDYDPEATCYEIDVLVDQWFPADSTALAWEIPAWLMIPDTSIQKAILLQGEGGNGKSTYLEMVRRFIGRHNTCSMSLQKLETNDFAPAGLLGKLANICPDLPTTHLENVSIFKAITTGEPVRAEFKHKPQFDLYPYARLVYSCNEFPKSNDSSEAFYQRWVPVTFPNSFRGEDQEVTFRSIMETVTSAQEQSGLLNKALEALPRLREHGFTISPSVRAAMAAFRETTDPLAVWLDQNTIDEPSAFVEKTVLCREYNRHAKTYGAKTLNDVAFGLALKKLRPHTEPRQHTIGGSRKWCYEGIGLIDLTKD